MTPRRAVATSHADFHPASWKRPFVATEIGETLPHWELAVYLLNPAKLSQSANTLKLTLGLLVALLLLAIAVGSWLIVSDLNRQLTLARQKQILSATFPTNSRLRSPRSACFRNCSLKGASSIPPSNVPTSASSQPKLPGSRV